MKFFAIIITIINFVRADFTVDLVRNAGYPVEVHHTFTRDGFKLRLHRIPQGIQKLHYEEATDDDVESSDKESVLLVHGLLAVGTQWVVGDKTKSLAFMLADAGFDVWLFNARGTTYSRYHKKWSYDSKHYWDFSWHEIAVRDLPAAIDYIKNETENATLHYVGHSQGGTVAMVLLSTMPEYNSKLRSVCLNAPAVFLQNMTSIAGSLVRYSNTLMGMANGLSLYAFVPGNAASKIITQVFCTRTEQTSEACTDILFGVIGNNTGQMVRVSNSFRSIYI